LQTVSFVEGLIRGIAVVSAVTDHTFRGFGKESLVGREFDAFRFLKRSADQVHGESKTMAVCDCRDFAALPAFGGPTPEPFFAR
jgi:hypothetical protein